MTVDSTYEPVDMDPAEGLLHVPFEIESIGDSAMQVWVQFPNDGSRIQIPNYKDVLGT